MTYILTMVLLISGAHVPVYVEFETLHDCIAHESRAYDNQDDDYIVLSSKCVKS